MNLYLVEGDRFGMLITAVVSCEEESNAVGVAGFEYDAEIEVSCLAVDVDLEEKLLCSETP